MEMVRSRRAGAASRRVAWSRGGSEGSAACMMCSFTRCQPVTAAVPSSDRCRLTVHEHAETGHAYREPRCPPALPDDSGPRLLVQDTSVSEHFGVPIPGLTPDMPGAVLALAFWTRHTHRR